MSQDSIILYRDIREAVMGLPPELCKAVMKVIFDYAFDDIEPEENTDAVIKGFYLAFKSRFDMNVARLEKNRSNGKKGGNPNFSKGKRNPYYPQEDNQAPKKDNRNITEDNQKDNPKDKRNITEDNRNDKQGITEKDNSDNRNITEKEGKTDKRSISEDNPKITQSEEEHNPTDNQKISEDKAYLYPYQYLNNNSVDVVADNAHARESENNNRKFLDEFFSETHRAQIEVICMQLHTDPDTLRKEAEEVIAEWELTRVTHNDYKEQAQHLINQLRIKYRSKLKDNGRTTKTSRESTAAAEDKFSGICGSTTKKKALRSTI